MKPRIKIFTSNRGASRLEEGANEFIASNKIENILSVNFSTETDRTGDVTYILILTYSI